MHLRYMYPLLVLAWRAPSAFKVWGAHSSRSRSWRNICPRGLQGHVLAQALGHPDSDRQSSQYSQHEGLRINLFVIDQPLRALTVVAQLVGQRPAKQKVAGSILRAHA